MKRQTGGKKGGEEKGGNRIMVEKMSRRKPAAAEIHRAGKNPDNVLDVVAVVEQHFQYLTRWRLGNMYHALVHFNIEYYYHSKNGQ